MDWKCGGKNFRNANNYNNEKPRDEKLFNDD
jgi:hypothetical protein